MTLHLGLVVRAAALTTGSVFACVACQEPGADWAPVDSGGTDSSTGVTSNSSLTSATTGDGNTSATSDGGSTETTGGSSTGAAGGTNSDTSAGSGGATTGNGTSDTTATSNTTGDGTSSTGNGGTGGVSADSLITNGDFASGESDWSFTGSGSVDASGGEYCVSLSADGEVSVGWPDGVDPAQLKAGSYQFSFDVYSSGSGTPSVNVKVGQAFDPYAAFVEEDVSIGTSPTHFTQSFSVSGDEQAGVLLRINGSSGVRVCLDNVMLVPE